MKNENCFSVIILAAGKGTRLGGKIPKPLSIINKESIISRLLRTVLKIKPEEVIVVVGYEAKQIIDHVSNYFSNINNIKFASQEILNGTLSAVEAGLTKVSQNSDYVLILPSDNGWFLKSSTLQSLIKNHIKERAIVSILLSREFDNNLHKMEYQVLNNQVSAIKLRSSDSNNRTSFSGTGIMCIEKEYIKRNKHLIEPLSNGEYIISRIIEVAIAQNKAIGYVIAKNNEVITINTKKDLKNVKMLARNN
jgi:bifunctional N-acetylglucosamine-1-phosphate-uridyltransferase/glucosamine-1-phosphate-acetyltransferase GlmU-like protein